MLFKLAAPSYAGTYPTGRSYFKQEISGLRQTAKNENNTFKGSHEGKPVVRRLSLDADLCRIIQINLLAPALLRNMHRAAFLFDCAPPATTAPQSRQLSEESNQMQLYGWSWRKCLCW